MSFNYLNLFKPNELMKDYHIRKPNDKSSLFEVEDKKHIYVGEKLVSFETNDKIVNYSSDIGFNDVKYAFAYSGEKIYFMVHRKYHPNQEFETSTEENEYHYLYKKDDELKGENKGKIEYCNDFINCRNIHVRNSTGMYYCLFSESRKRNILVNPFISLVIDGFYKINLYFHL